MDRPKLRPTVIITTYSSSSSSSSTSKLSHVGGRKNGQQEDNCEARPEEATKSEFSTDFFNKLRGHARPFASNQTNRVLIDLSQIKGPTGSIRGHRDVVRKSLEGIKVAYNRRLNFSPGSFTGGPANLSASLVKEHCSLLNSASSSASMPTTNYKHAAYEHWPRGAGLLSSLQNMEHNYHGEYLERLHDEEQGTCVIYTTSLGVIRRTFEDSKIMKSILNLNLIKYEERDIFLNQEYKHQLRVRLSAICVPAIFVDGQHFGGLKELEMLNENGDLLKRLARFKMSTSVRSVCPCCGNAKFIACQSCNGSRKSTIHHFKFNSIALRCIKCDKNEGLVQCPVCSVEQALSENQLLPSPLDQNNNEASDKIVMHDDVIEASSC